MQNIESILQEFWVTVPEGKAEALLKRVAENYRTVADYEKQGEKLKKAVERAEKAEGLLAKLPKDVDPETYPKLLEEAQNAAKNAKEDFDRQLAERDFDEALETALKDVKFTSPGARRDVIRQIKEAGLPVKDRRILGLDDVLKDIREKDSSSFTDEKQEEMEAGKARLKNAAGKTDDGKKDREPLTKEKIMGIQDRAARRKAIAENMDLFNNKED